MENDRVLHTYTVYHTSIRPDLQEKIRKKRSRYPDSFYLI